MSPGINDHPFNTGTLPKSNRRSDRNRERDRSSVNQYSNWYGQAPSQCANNLFQCGWHPVTESPQTTTISKTTSTSKAATTTSAKNSNTRTTPAIYAFDDFEPYSSSHRKSVSSSSSSSAFTNLTKQQKRKDSAISWLKMTPPVDTTSEARAESPPKLPAKPTNTDKMPDRGQVEGRLHQIREYIKVTSTMMDSLSQSSDPNGESGEGGSSSREQELRKKVEESQRKLAQLQEHQALLVGMQLQVRERLTEARQNQQRLLADGVIDDNDDEDNENDDDDDDDEEDDGENEVIQGEDEESRGRRLERETIALKGKLQDLENKKRHMDHLVQELQAVELASCSSESSRAQPSEPRDKVAELETLKAQLAHLKALMGEATANCPEDEHEVNITEESSSQQEQQQPPPQYHECTNSFNDLEEALTSKGDSNKPPSVEQIQAITRELKEQHQLLQTARAELRRLKQSPSTATIASNPIPCPAPSLTNSITPPPSLLVAAEKKQSNNRAQNNQRRQFEDFMRKDESNELPINQNGTIPEWGSRRGSNSQHSHSSTPANLWTPPVVNLVTGSHDHGGVDSLSAATDNLLEIGSQAPLENGFGNNFWGMPPILTNQSPQGIAVGSTEYYKQLLLGSQAQQLQMMSTTIQQCYQLLWSQQREMQSMKSAIAQLQAQLRISQSRTSNNLLDAHHEEQHSNLCRAQQQQQQGFSSLDGPLPPSSSLPNLVSLPTSLSPIPVIPVISNCNNQPQAPPAQLNNQVPPGNRANNYWDNFRSYSRQNLLSGSSKTVTDCAASVSSVHATSATNTASSVIIGSHVNNKCNRQQELPTTSSLPTVNPDCNSSTQYNSFYIQQQEPQQLPIAPPPVLRTTNNRSSPQHQLPESQLLQQDAIVTADMVEMNNSTTSANAAGSSEGVQKDDDLTTARIAQNITNREDLRKILIHCLKVLEARKKRNESPVPSSNISNSSNTSDDESENGTRRDNASSNPNIEHVRDESHSPAFDLMDSACCAPILNITPPRYFEEDNDFEFAESCPADKSMISLPSVSSSTQGFNEASPEADQLRLEPLSNQLPICEQPINGYSSPNCSLDNSEVAEGWSLEEVNEVETDNTEYVMLDNSNSQTNSNHWLQQQSRKSRRHRSSSRVDQLQK